MSTRDAQFAELLASSYATLVGEPLVPEGVDAAGWLYEAPFGLLAHDTSPDPLFVYANLTAQKLFEYSWGEFSGLPSRLSAGQDDRRTREELLEGVRTRGCASGYRGPRVAKSGRRFWIDDVTVWNLLQDDGTRVGQAAVIPRWDEA
ncbi:MEKHLA domain-containing protein [Kineosporia mesophila]|uniref:MEKHLA domain-containing protein n=1 Tax=Kineosporia mesophila TaxID=566012 RepID=A0ABP7A9C2_9ACTN|nr:MEKHLA domain-containing protein [Kineosporia mesophila]MCD5355153.1 MEKHLA domain-containing protein [Kineosporia mesophila]